MHKHMHICRGLKLVNKINSTHVLIVERFEHRYSLLKADNCPVKKIISLPLVPLLRFVLLYCNQGLSLGLSIDRVPTPPIEINACRLWGD